MEGDVSLGTCRAAGHGRGNVKSATNTRNESMSQEKNTEVGKTPGGGVAWVFSTPLFNMFLGPQRVGKYI